MRSAKQVVETKATLTQGSRAAEGSLPVPYASETELVAACQRGDAEAWDEVFQRHYAATGRFVFQLAPDFTHEDVEEICQETFLTVIKNIGSFQGHSQFQTWLFRIAVHKAHDFRQKQRAAKRGGGQTLISLQAEDPDNGLPLDPPSPLPGPAKGQSRMALS